MTENLELAFAALSASPPPPHGQLATLRANSSPHPPAWVGLDRTGHPHLLLPFDADPPPVPEALTTQPRSLVLEGVERQVLDLSCTTRALAEVFEKFAAAVVDALPAASGPTAALRDVLEQWRRFLTSTGAAPSRDRLAGIAGELLVLIDLTRLDTGAAAWWTGPAGARHDFRRSEHAIEVKTTLATTSTRITVNGAEQLLPPDDGTLHLHHVRLEAAPDGPCSVAGLVDMLLDLNAPVDILYRALDDAGLPPALIGSTRTTTFTVRARTTLAVDDRLPRIVPASFIDARQPDGTDALSYQVDLGPHLDRALDEAGWSTVLTGLATGVPS